MKKVLSYCSSVVIGYSIGQNIFFALFTLSGLLLSSKIISFAQVQNIISNKYITVYTFLILSFLIIISIIAYSRNSWLREIFKPVKEKILFNLIVLLLLAVFSSFSSHFTFISSQSLSAVNVISKPLQFVWSILKFYLLLYPFSSILYTFRDLTNKKNNINFVVLLVFLVILNPLTLFYGNTTYAAFSYSVNLKSNNLHKCGAQVWSVDKGGPAEMAGIKPLSFITLVDNVSIIDFGQLTSYLKSITVQKTVVVRTELGTYTVPLEKDAQTNSYRLGIQVNQAYCK